MKDDAKLNTKNMTFMSSWYGANNSCLDMREINVSNAISPMFNKTPILTCFIFAQIFY